MNQDLDERISKSAIDLNDGEPKKIKIRGGETYALLPGNFLVQGLNNSGLDKCIVNVQDMGEDLVRYIKDGYEGSLITPSSDNMLVYNGKEVRYCTSWSNLWDQLLGCGNYDSYLI